MSETRPEGDRAEPDASVGDLVARASQDISRLVRAEIELAKMELAYDAKRVGIGAGFFAATAFMLHLVLILVSVALALGIAAFGLPTWAGFLIAGGIYVLVAALFALIGYTRMKGLAGLKRTRRTLSDDLSMIRRGGGEPDSAEAVTGVRQTD